MPPQQIPQPTATIASFDSYDEALSTTGYLHDHGLPTERLGIVGSDLRQLEQASVRGDTLRFTLAGAGNGAWLGALVGILIAVFAASPNSNFSVVFWAIVYGILFGTLRGLVLGLAHGRPGAHRWESIVAARFDVLCTPTDASVAAQLLERRDVERSTAPADEQGRVRDHDAA